MGLLSFVEVVMNEKELLTVGTGQIGKPTIGKPGNSTCTKDTDSSLIPHCVDV